jgi:hypothetical protein
MPRDGDSIFGDFRRRVRVERKNRANAQEYQESAAPARSPCAVAVVPTVRLVGAARVMITSAGLASSAIPEPLAVLDPEVLAVLGARVWLGWRASMLRRRPPWRTEAPEAAVGSGAQRHLRRDSRRSAWILHRYLPPHLSKCGSGILQFRYDSFAIAASFGFGQNASSDHP